VITVVDPDAPRVADRLHRRHPQLEGAADVVVVTADIDPLEAAAVTSVCPDIAFVCIDDDAVALQAGLRLRSLLAPSGALVVVELVRAEGIAGLVDKPGQPDHIRAFDLYRRTMRPELLLGGTYELLARAIHAEYVDEQRRLGVTTDTNQSVVVWELLPEALKESNRDQAAHIGTKLAAVGRGMAPLGSWDVDTNIFTETEIEQLAELEHERWVRQRRIDGWTPGPRNVREKKTPYLVEWDALTDDVKEWDRQAVRKIPVFLARAGYQIVGSQT
jgi:hypothetical protein